MDAIHTDTAHKPHPGDRLGCGQAVLDELLSKLLLNGIGSGGFNRPIYRLGRSP